MKRLKELLQLRRIRAFLRKALLACLGRLLLVPLSLLDLVRAFRLCGIRGERIGHFAAAEPFFRAMLAEDGRAGIWRIGLIQGCANSQILKMYRRRMPVIVSRSLHTVVRNSAVARSAVHVQVPISCRDRDDERYPIPALSFTPGEVAHCERRLREIGIGPEDWFVCFHNRDRSYLRRWNTSRDWDYHDFRDNSIADYYPAMHRVLDSGGFVLRMGNVVQEPLRLSDDRAFDFSAQFEDSLLEVFVTSRCRFFVGTTSGLCLVPLMFNVPVGLVDYVPLRELGRLPFACLLPKLFRSKKGKDLVPFREAHALGLDASSRADFYEKSGVEVVNNSAEEIRELTEEMMDRVEGSDSYTDGDDALQMAFRAAFGQDECRDLSRARIGKAFLERYQHLLS